MTNKPPPSSPGVERSVLGSLLVLPDIIASTIEKLPVMAFYGAHNRKIYAAIVDMYDNEKVPDLVSLAERLRVDGDIESCGGEGYLSELVEDVNTSPNLKSWIEILISHAAKRKIITDCALITGQAYQEQASVENLVTQFGKSNENILDFCEDHGVKHRKRGKIVRISDVWDETKKYHSDGIEEIGLRITDWPVFSKYYRIVKGLLCIVTGIPTHGKTTFLDQVITDSVINHNFKWAIFSPENKPFYLHIKPMAEKIVSKRFFGESGICEGELEYVKSKLKDNIFFIEPDNHNKTMTEIKRLTKKTIDDFGVDGVIIDPWNKVLHEWEGRETIYIKNELMKCQDFARANMVSFNIVVHPRNELDGKKVPTPKSIDGSAHWYNSSDGITTVWRDFDKDVIEIHQQKVKFVGVHGDLGIGYFRYNKNNTKLDEITKEQAKSAIDYDNF